MKIRRISQFQAQFSFLNFDELFSRYQESFLSSDLGKIYLGIPWEKLTQALNLKENIKGPTSMFSPRGKVALMFLKHYCCVSDRKLIDQFNGNIYYQMFCDSLLSPGYRINNYKIVSQIRCELASLLDIDALEKVFMDYWRPYMQNLDSVTCDATCYESGIRYPTDIKLLWESVQWIYRKTKTLCKTLKLRMLRSKYHKWSSRSVSYSKMRRKTKKKRRSLTRGLLNLLAKLEANLTMIEQSHPEIKTNQQYKKRRKAIATVLAQQTQKFYQGKRPQSAIVSIDKPYLRPIVRGKEVKPVEFGAKVHKLQIDGISFIEHLIFEAYNEGTRIKQVLYKAQSLSHQSVKLLGADAIYATNANRKLLSSKAIQTDFKIKGKRGKHYEHKKQIAMMISKERVSRLEGSFGTDKEYFLLKKVKARNQKTERLWIFFGIHTANALNMGKRISSKTLNQKKVA